MADRVVLEFNGTYFETVIAELLMAKYPDAVILHDVSLYCDYLQKDTQIDVILLHPKALFVIEAKNWAGWVKGGYNDDKWRGKSLGKDVMTVFSPFNQNFIHIRTLRNMLRNKAAIAPYFYNFVCFPDGTDIMSGCTEVCNLSSMLQKIDYVIRKSEFNYNVNELKRIITT